MPQGGVSGTEIELELVAFGLGTRGQEGDPARPRGTHQGSGGSEVGRSGRSQKEGRGNLPAKLSAQRIWSQGGWGWGRVQQLRKLIFEHTKHLGRGSLKSRGGQLDSFSCVTQTPTEQGPHQAQAQLSSS